MLSKIEMIHNENALKSAIYFKDISEDIQNILLGYMRYMHSDSLLFLSKISSFIKDKNIFSWIRGDVGESLLKLNLDVDKEISIILKEILLDKSINTKTRYNIARRIFKFQKDKNFIQEIGKIINDKNMSTWVRGGLIYALSDIENRDHIEIILEFMSDSNVNDLVKVEISQDVIPFLLKSKKDEYDTFKAIVNIIENNNSNFKLRSILSLILSSSMHFDTIKIKILCDLIKNPMLDIVIKLNLAEVLLKLNYQDKKFLLSLESLIKNKNIKFWHVQYLFDFLHLKQNLNKEYIKFLDILRSKLPKYKRVNGRYMKTSTYVDARSKGICF